MSRTIPLLIVAIAVLPWTANADEITKIIQQDLVTLGYDPGPVDGEATTKTIVAISKFQAEHDLPVTGEASPQLAGIVKAAISQQGQPVAAASAPAAASTPPPVRDEAELRAAQQACLQQRMAAAQESQKKKRGFASLARAVTRTAARIGGDDVSREVAQLSSDVYTADAIASDLISAAEDLGLTESDLEACRNP
jgi:peptidoglycan hydrolase-like protein with peptidoglycan-binding domain